MHLSLKSQLASIFRMSIGFCWLARVLFGLSPFWFFQSSFFVLAKRAEQNQQQRAKRPQQKQNQTIRPNRRHCTAHLSHCLQVLFSAEDNSSTTTTMSKWFRSEPMEYISIIMNEDAAHDCLSDLGKIGAIQFTDVSIATSEGMTVLKVGPPFLVL